MITSSKQSPESISFFEPAILPTITAQEKDIACKPIRTKRGRVRYVPHLYDNEDLKAAKRQLKEILRPHAPAFPFDEAVTCRVLWVWPWRKGEPAKNRQHGNLICYTRPDCGNLTKALEDLMEELGYFTVDSRIGHPEMIKAWGDVPGLGVEVRPVRLIPPSFSNLLHLQEFGNNPNQHRE